MNQIEKDIDPERIEVGVKLISKYMEAGVYKLSDILEEGQAKLGVKFPDYFEAIKASYGAYYSQAPDNIAKRMDSLEDVRKLTIENFSKAKKNKKRTQMKLLKYSLIAVMLLLFVSLLVLVLTNPSQNDFHHFITMKTGSVGTDSKLLSARVGYYFIFSTFEYKAYYPLTAGEKYRGGKIPDEKETGSYLGIFNNFIEIEKNRKYRKE